MRSHHRLLATLTVLLLSAASGAAAQDRASAREAPAGPEEPAARFRSAVDLVSVSAVVRDGRGRLVPSLTKDDFEVLDAGQRRTVIDFHSDVTAPASVAILVDGSGSMVLGGAREYARRIAAHLLAGLSAGRDTAALLSFDTRLLTLCEFTRDFEQVRGGFAKVEAFGATSLYDAVAGSAALAAQRTQNRRAVVVITDGSDNASHYSPAQVAWMASTIDVPVYIFAVGDEPGAPMDENRAGPLADLARGTGGDLFLANTPRLIAAAVTRVTEELRHQYVLAFESDASEGLRRLEIRTRPRRLTVTARRWYHAQDQ